MFVFNSNEIKWQQNRLSPKMLISGKVRGRQNDTNDVYDNVGTIDVGDDNGDVNDDDDDDNDNDDANQRSTVGVDKLTFLWR